MMNFQLTETTQYTEWFNILTEILQSGEIMIPADIPWGVIDAFFTQQRAAATNGGQPPSSQNSQH